MNEIIDSVATRIDEVEVPVKKAFPYSIYIGKKEGKVDVMLDGNNPSNIPTIVAAGVGNKHARYKKWLDDSYSKNTQLLRFLAFIHKTGKEQGSINLLCRCQFASFHPLCIKEFLMENAETLDTLIPYMFNEPGAAPVETQQPQPEMPNMFSGNKVTLPPHEMEQIMESIRRSQEEEALKEIEQPV
jgi:hypothetical protein